jgi:hypothetical protein
MQSNNIPPVTSSDDPHRPLPKYLIEDQPPPKKRIRGKRKTSPSDEGAADGREEGEKSKVQKVGKACVYCQRSHMTCDESEFSTRTTPEHSSSIGVFTIR